MNFPETIRQPAGVPMRQMNPHVTEQAIEFVTPRFLEGAPPGKPNQVALTPEVQAMLDRQAVCAVGISGGKDSDACAIAVSRYLDQIGHKGPRLLVHSDLGRIEWRDSLPSCERLAQRLGWELLVVRRQAGDMLDRWEKRWQNNVSRYEDLSCVKLILPWSTPSMRFCTSYGDLSSVNNHSGPVIHGNPKASMLQSH
jgi:hypothetical protein